MRTMGCGEMVGGGGGVGKGVNWTKYSCAIIMKL